MKKLREFGQRLLLFLKQNAKEKRLVAALVLGISGIVLLAISGLCDGKIQEEPQPAAEVTAADTAVLEERLESLLGTVEGVGEVRVMVTMENSGEQVMARNSEAAGDNGENGISWKENSEYAVVDGKTVLLKTTEPTVRGVAVVCEGGDSPKVRERVSATLTAVLGIHSNRVSVVCMEKDGG